MSMFLDLNSVLVKFWKEQGNPSKEVRIQLLKRMIHWYEHEGTITLDSNIIDPEKDKIDKGFTDFIKSDPLFDECLANVSDEIIQEVNNKLDERLNKTKN